MNLERRRNAQQQNEAEAAVRQAWEMRSATHWAYMGTLPARFVAMEDNPVGGRLAARHFIEHGHTQFAWISLAGHG